jgi:hypothetical protein
MSEYARTTAKYSTRCPRCKQPIKIDALIVKADDESVWSHAVCPRSLMRKPEPCEIYTMKIVDGKVVQELVTK